ncbi:MAG: hypothetical protein Q8Q02_09705 [Nocardioides sp.]|nr:hypothetical protein [Nocardioides sp.]
MRHPDRHMEWCEHSYFRAAPEAWTTALRQQVERNEHTLHQFSDIPLFVSTPDLLMHHPNATWLPLTVDLESLSEIATESLFQQRKPQVLHIPSRRNPPIKGTHIIDRVLCEMDKENLIAYISPAAQSHPAMLRRMAEADIVVDQLLSGSYGATTVEAMALGRIVVCGVHAEVSRRLPAPLPVIEATPLDFEERMRNLIRDPQVHLALSGQGRDYVQRWHSGVEASDQIVRWYGAS